MPLMKSLRASHRATNVAALFAVSIATCVVSLPAHAFTCEDVRGLSKAQQDYWSKRLNLTGEQRHRIWVACYKDYRPNNRTRQALAGQ